MKQVSTINVTVTGLVTSCWLTTGMLATASSGSDECKIPFQVCECLCACMMPRDLYDL